MISTEYQQDFGKVIHIFSDIGTNTPRFFLNLNLIRPNRLLPSLKTRPARFPLEMIGR